MLNKFYLGWGVLVCGWLMTADALGWKSPILFPPGQSLNSRGGAGYGVPYYYGTPGGAASRGSGGSWGWGGGK
jgi:hypothetical protein